MNIYTSHISFYDVAALGIVFTGLNFALLLGFTKKLNRPANRFLAVALAVMVLWIVRILRIDTTLPLQFSLAPGPLIYFYVLKLTRPEYQFSRKDWLHFVPALLEPFMLPNRVLPRRFKCPTSTQTPVSVPLTYPKCKPISGPGRSPETGNN
ncbi:hypothetical protein [Mucilaginibacter gotjawali]|uniref:Uncharacterized protein n=1 Tax=Mucilaginibacter gotjawali TaxID=1550579 RepID=A0A839SEL0_9SPHI|nr:hypothetical protein [Mucilaginibacter gotjawali]MBB3055330.1 hypothetical protein [Mucilaginibacter gotjawali]